VPESERQKREHGGRDKGDRHVKHEGLPTLRLFPVYLGSAANLAMCAPGTSFRAQTRINTPLDGGAILLLFPQGSGPPYFRYVTDLKQTYGYRYAIAQ
jgi:hypothetical protein